MADSFEYYAIGILIVIVIIWGIIQVSSENKAKSDWIKTNNYRFNFEKSLISELEKLGDALPNCSKCNSTEMQIWSLSANNIEIRCIDCKKKFLISNPDDIFLNKINSLWHEVMLIINEHSKLNKYPTGSIAEYIRTNLHFNYWNLRANTPYIRAIYFESNPSIEIYPTKADVNSNTKSRRILQKTKDAVWNRDGGRCVECGSQEYLEFDHIIPFSKGGSNTYRNIQLLCEACNRVKSSKIG